MVKKSDQVNIIEVDRSTSEEPAWYNTIDSSVNNLINNYQVDLNFHLDQINN